MKSRIFTAISTLVLGLFFALPQAEACWWPDYTTKELWLYRILPYGTPFECSVNRMEDNCKLWQQQTSTDISTEDIQTAVYQYSAKNWQFVEQYLNGERDYDVVDTVNKMVKANGLVRHIVQKGDREALDFLLVAKSVEETRTAMRDPWYYSADFDAEHAVLRKAIDDCKNHTNGRFANRYALQAMRVLFSLKQYEKCIQYWESVAGNLSQDVLYGMAENYAGGAYLKLGNKEKALDIFSRNDDIESIQSMGYNFNKAFETLFEKNPNSNYFPGKLQEMIFSYEHHVWFTYAYEWEDVYMKPDDKYIIQATWLNQFARKAAADPRVKDPLLWAYVVGCTSDFLSKSEEGLTFLKQYLHHTSSNAFLNQSAEVLRIFLQTKATPYSLTDTEAFLADLKWIENNMVQEIKTPHYTIKVDEWNTFESAMLFDNAWKRVLWEGAIPNALAAGDTTLAIFYANAAENLYINSNGTGKDVHNPKMSPLKEVAPYLDKQLTDDKWYEMYEKEIEIHFNYHDYSNLMFKMVDSLNSNTIIRYWEATQTPKTPMQSYLLHCSYLDADYWQEIIGTHALRELNYPLAVTHLSKVSSDYQYRTNVYRDNGMWRNPFHYNPKYNLDPIDDNRNYKLTFAQDMAELEQKIAHSSDPNVRARSMILYALGMKNSMNYCWGLTYYSKTSYQWLWIDGEEEEEYKKYFDEYAPAEAKYRTQVWNQADSLIQAAFPLFTDPEQAAMEYSKLAMVWKVAELYPDTETGRWLSRHCDLWEDYVKAAKAKKQ